MTADDFVAVVDLVVRQGAAASTMPNLERPPGRSPQAELVELAKWFANLEQSDKDAVKAVAMLASSHAVCGFLSVLDGARAIENPPHKGHLELWYVNDHFCQRTRLNDPESEPLNDKLRA